MTLTGMDLILSGFIVINLLLVAHYIRTPRFGLMWLSIVAIIFLVAGIMTRHMHA